MSSDDRNPYESAELASKSVNPPEAAGQRRTDWFGVAALTCAVLITLCLVTGFGFRAGTWENVPLLLTVAGVVFGCAARKQKLAYVLAALMPWLVIILWIGAEVPLGR